VHFLSIFARVPVDTLSTATQKTVKTNFPYSGTLLERVTNQMNPVMSLILIIGQIKGSTISMIS
jgi:hypothetical protein